MIISVASKLQFDLLLFPNPEVRLPRPDTETSIETLVSRIISTKIPR